MEEIFLFSGNSAYDFQRAVLNSVDSWARRLDENAILGATTDELISQALSQYPLDFPSLDAGGVWVEEKEEEIEINNRGYDIFSDTHGGRRHQKVHFVEFHVPFTGSRDLFRYAPSTRDYPGVRAAILSDNLKLRISTEGKSSDVLRSELDTFIKTVERHLATLKREVGSLPTSIANTVRPIVEDRKDKLLKSKSVVANLGFPMKRRDDAPATYKAPEVRRRLAPSVPAAIGKAQKPEPAIEEADYQNILSVMDNMTKVMERSPHAFKDMKEEDIRQHFLVQLNGQYEGQATGETFNYEGKTDILIRSGDKNVFIAECKFWHGEKKFLETVDQLLGYLSWRDTKAAVVIFNRNKNLSGVLEAIKTAMKAHPKLKNGPQIEGETRFRYVLKNPNDHDREIIVTIMAYDIPTD
jgi:hypothetical protein